MQKFGESKVVLARLSEARHILTIESPIEYVFRPKSSFIRQREVGRDTPSFEQGLLDFVDWQKTWIE